MGKNAQIDQKSPFEYIYDKICTICYYSGFYSSLTDKSWAYGDHFKFSLKKSQYLSCLYQISKLWYANYPSTHFIWERLFFKSFFMEKLINFVLFQTQLSLREIYWVYWSFANHLNMDLMHTWYMIVFVVIIWRKIQNNDHLLYFDLSHSCKSLNNS